VPFLDCGFLFAVLQVCADKLSTLFVFPFRSDCTLWFTVGSGGAEHPYNSLSCYGIQTVELEAAYWIYAWFSCVFHTAWQIDFGSWVVHCGGCIVCTSTGQLLSHVIVCWVVSLWVCNCILHFNQTCVCSRGFLMAVLNQKVCECSSWWMWWNPLWSLIWSLQTMTTVLCKDRWSFPQQHWESYSPYSLHLFPCPFFRHSVSWTFRLFSTVTCGYIPNVQKLHVVMVQLCRVIEFISFSLSIQVFANNCPLLNLSFGKFSVLVPCCVLLKQCNSLLFLQSTNCRVPHG